MNPIYKFELSAGEESRQAFPVYKDDLAIEYALEQNQEFYRGKLSGKLTFQRDDYTFIRNKSFDTQFDVVISISYDAGQTWAVYWSGQFWKTDCQFNEDDQTAIVTPNVNDRYNAVLAGMEKEYNLIELAPEMQPVKMDKRPMIQVYVPGQTVVGCFLSGMWWEQECEKITNTTDLVGRFHFILNKSIRFIDVSQPANGNPTLPQSFWGITPADPYDFSLHSGGYIINSVITYSQGITIEITIVAETATNRILWKWEWGGTIPPSLPLNITLTPEDGAQSVGNVNMTIRDVPIYARCITDNESQGSPITADDPIYNNRNYKYAAGYYAPDSIIFTDILSSSPTKWGCYQSGLYYIEPLNPGSGINECFPISRTEWGRASIWFAFSIYDLNFEQRLRKQFVLRDAYPIFAVISSLLNVVAPGITHEGTTTYSQFLYGTNPITGIIQRLEITPKSNLISAGYDQPAQKAMITLKTVLDMLRDCFRCYWFIDEQNRFRIEHISWFMRGGSYSGTPVVGMDLTTLRVARNGKPWSYDRNQYQFDKPEMAARYQFGWMDDVTEYFDGFPIDIISKYVNPENIENIDVSKFTSDVDYIMLNPDGVSKDGFALLGPVFTTSSSSKTINFSINAMYLTNGPSAGEFHHYNGTCATQLIPIDNTIVGATFKISQNQLGFFFIDIAVFDINQNFIGVVEVYEDDVLKWEFPLSIVRERYPAARYIGLTIWNIEQEEELTQEDVQDIVITQTTIVGDYKLPYYNYIAHNTNHYLQNAYLAFIYLQNYYAYDMPAKDYSINGVQMVATGIKKLKQQTLKFPVLADPDLMKLIKTGLGNGVIQKMSVNLSSRNANTTLKYDTE